MILITQDCLKQSRMLIVLGAMGNLFFIAPNVSRLGEGRLLTENVTTKN